MRTRTKKRTRLSFEQFEDRLVPASWNYTVDGLGNFTITQTAPAVGATLTIADSGTSLTFTDADTPATKTISGLLTASNVTLNLLSSNPGSMTVEITSLNRGNSHSPPAHKRKPF